MYQIKKKCDWGKLQNILLKKVKTKLRHKSNVYLIINYNHFNEHNKKKILFLTHCQKKIRYYFHYFLSSGDKIAILTVPI